MISLLKEQEEKWWIKKKKIKQNSFKNSINLIFN
jgi:hypothetical protein